MRGIRKRRGGSLSFFIIMVAITAAAALASVLLLEMQRSRRQPVYEAVSLTEEASAEAYIWLDRIEDMPLTYAEIKEIMGTIELKLVLTPTGEKGHYTQAPEEGSAEACMEQARRGLEQAYRKVAAHRLVADGYEGEISDGLLDSLMQDAYGVSVAEYLASCEVRLLPTAEELAEMYSGEVTRE